VIPPTASSPPSIVRPHKAVRTSRLVGVSLLFLGLTLGSFGSLRVLAVPPTTLEIEGTATATSATGTSIVVGDVFSWSILLDLDADSTGSIEDFGNTFNDSIVSFALTAAPTNFGTWNPSDVTWPVSPASNVAANANGNGVTVQLRPTNAPLLNDAEFLDLGLSFWWNSSDFDAIWVEGPTTLGKWLRTTTPNLAAASFFFELRDAGFNSDDYEPAGFSTSVTVSSTPTTPTTPSVPPFIETPATTTTITTTAPTGPPVSVPTSVPALTNQRIEATAGQDLGAPNPMASGMTVDMSGINFAPGARVEAYLASTPLLLGVTTADPSGNAAITVTIPPNYEGIHSLILFEPVTGLIQRQVVEITATALPSTGASSSPFTLVVAILALLAGAVLVRWPSFSLHAPPKKAG
jgi:LPXTG-motif cell wall-anchored protein